MYKTNTHAYQTITDCSDNLFYFVCSSTLAVCLKQIRMRIEIYRGLFRQTLILYFCCYPCGMFATNTHAQKSSPICSFEWFIYKCGSVLKQRDPLPSRLRRKAVCSGGKTVRSADYFTTDIYEFFFPDIFILYLISMHKQERQQKQLHSQ